MDSSLNRESAGAGDLFFRGAGGFPFSGVNFVAVDVAVIDVAVEVGPGSATILPARQQFCRTLPAL